MWTRERLVQNLENGGSADYVFFWGHTPKREGFVDRACFSQWFPRAFTVNDVRYASAEHFMMAGKARLFADQMALAQVLAATSPADAKAIGRTVRGFDDARWSEARFAIVVEGNVAKFGQHPDLLACLLETKDKVIVEASPRDRIW